MAWSVQKSIRLSMIIYNKASVIAKDMGLSFQDYLRYLIVEDLRRINTAVSNKKDDKDEYFARKYINDLQKQDLNRLMNEIAKKMDY